MKTFFPAATRVGQSLFATGSGEALHPSDLHDEKANELVNLFKLLADETRLRIIYFLMQQDEVNVGTFCRLLTQSQPAVSHHLALLKGAGLIDCRRDGKHNFYRLVPKRCQAYLDVLFGVNGTESRRICVEDALLTYGHDGREVS